MAEVMTALGHQRFHVVGHDRGGRVAHRLARDHGKRVRSLTVLDISPTLKMYESTNMQFAKAYYHWFFLIQKAPLPEKMLGRHGPAVHPAAASAAATAGCSTSRRPCSASTSAASIRAPSTHLRGLPRGRDHRPGARPQGPEEASCRCRCSRSGASRA